MMTETLHVSQTCPRRGSLADRLEGVLGSGDASQDDARG